MQSLNSKNKNLPHSYQTRKCFTNYIFFLPSKNWKKEYLCYSQNAFRKNILNFVLFYSKRFTQSNARSPTPIIFYTNLLVYFYEGMPEWSNGLRLGRSGFCLRGFESSFPHIIRSPVEYGGE